MEAHARRSSTRYTKWWKFYPSVDIPLLAAFALAIGIVTTGMAHQATLSTTPPPSSVVYIGDDKGHGSGFSIGDRYILTAAHVAGDQKILHIKSATGYVQDGKVLWTNPDYDIALVRVASTGTIGTARLNCAPMHTGDAVVSKGNPVDIEFVQTTGTVAGPARKYGPWESIVPVSLSLIPGMSGGPIVNAAGEVVGINVGVMAFNTGLSSSLVGIGYIVPASVVCDLLAVTADIAKS